MTKKRKTPGQLAYESELKFVPEYKPGLPRPAWEHLSEHAKSSWEKNPTPRWTEQPIFVKTRESAGL